MAKGVRKRRHVVREENAGGPSPLALRLRQPRLWLTLLGVVAVVVLAYFGWRYLTTPHLKVVAVREDATSVLVTAREKPGLSHNAALGLINQAKAEYPGKQQTTVEIYDDPGYADARVNNPGAHTQAEYDQHRLASFYHDSKTGDERWELPKQ